MKKKIALLLAAAMTIACLPTNVFAASSNRVTDIAQNVPKKTVLVGVSGYDGLTKITDFKDVDYFVRGGYLELELGARDTITTGTMFRLSLENAEWFFRNDLNNEENRLQTYNSADGEWDNSRTFTYTRDVNGLKPGGYNKATGGLYELEVSNLSKKEAVVTFNDSIVSQGANSTYVRIPLVVRTTDEGIGRVRLHGSTSSVITQNSYTFAETTANATKASVDDPVTAITKFPLNKLVIKETRANSMKASGWFTLKLPSGFEFTNEVQNDNELIIRDKDNQPLFLSSKTSVEPGFGSTPTANAYFKIVGSGDNEKIDRSTVYVYYSGLGISSRLPGYMYFTEFFNIEADDNAKFGDFNITISDGAPSSVEGNSGDYNAGTGKAGVTGESFKAGTRQDYKIEFTAETPTELYNGKYEDDYESDLHLAAKVTFKELLAQSWWLHRRTEFTLPEGVKIRAVEITEKDKITDDIKKVYTAAVNGETSKKDGLVTLYDSSIVFNDLSREKNTDKVKLEMKFWLSIAPGFEGDVVLSVSGNALEEDLNTVTIAKAKNPIVVEAKSVTDIVIGYQGQETADFSITEAEAGILERAKTVKIALTDGISRKMSFAVVPTVSIDGDLKIGTVKLTASDNSTAFTSTLGDSSSGTLSFAINGGSSKASTINFSNVQVYLDRTVSYTNVKPYQIIVWGDAVAANYDATTKANNDTFTIPGYAVDYVKVVTSAEGNTVLPKVSVTIGDPIMTIGDKTVTMDTTPFIDPASNSTMIPVRFVAEALGIPSDQVRFVDQDRTVTIYANDGRVIQFQIGSDVLVVNGVPAKMTSPDGLPVSAVIRNERSFIPFRALGNALGVPVEWYPDTQTAVFGDISAE